MMTKLVLILFLVTTVNLHAQEKPEGLFINSKAPDFKAKDQNGNEVVLKDIRKKGPVVLIFYRGYWCPYCNKELQKLEDSLQLIKEKGAQLIAITPEKQEGIAKTIEKTKASYSIVADSAMKIMKAYDVAYQVDDKTVGRYKMANIDLAENNGQKAGSIYLPVPAVYIINKDGEISYRFFDFDYRNQASVKIILDNLKGLK
ncbi:MAG TPA: peroxiredoxin-like family protein [Chitinophagaceae bacterium]|jgi:peroxiredoxin|nr:peroxiredoxin-like family protein [Chitinophagaceae bacterium]